MKQTRKRKKQDHRESYRYRLAVARRKDIEIHAYYKLYREWRDNLEKYN